MRKQLYSSFIFPAFFFLFSLLIMLPMANLPEVFQVSEAREGVVIKELDLGNDFILPLRHLKIIPSKPPLFHWFSHFLSSLFGKFFAPELLLRLSSLLSGSALVAVLASFSSKYFSAELKILPPLILLTNYNFLRLGTDGRVDMLFYFFSSTAFLILLNNFLQGGDYLSRHRLKFVLLISAAVLTKGPLAYLLLIMILGAWFILKPNLKFFIQSLFRIELSLLIIMPFIWYALAWQRGGDDFISRVFFENVGRFSGAEGIVPKYFYFYLEHFWLQFSPWSFIFLGCLIFAIFKMKEFKKFFFFKLDNLSRELFLRAAIWFTLILLFLSLSSGKRKGYLLLCSVPFSILVTYLFEFCRQNAFKSSISYKIFSYYLRIVPILVILLSILIFLPDLKNYLGDSNKLYFSLLENNVYLNKFTYLFLSFLGSLLIIIFLIRNKLSSLFGGFVFSLFFLMTFHLPILMSIKARTRSYKVFAKAVFENAREGERDNIYFIKENDDERFESLFFYYPKRIRLTQNDSLEAKEFNEKSLFLARRDKFDSQFKEISEEIIFGGRASDSKEEELVLFRAKN